MNHIFDWVLNDDAIQNNTKINCVQYFNTYYKEDDLPIKILEFVDMENFPEIKKEQKIVRDLSNKSKHFIIEEIGIQERELNCCAGSVNMYAGNVNAMAGYFEKYKYFVEIDGEKVDLVTVFEILIDEWSDYLKNIF